MDMSQIASDFGLAGLVIASLFYLIHKFIEDMRAVRAEHKDERTEWRVSQEHRDERMDQTITGLTIAIQEQSRRHRSGD